MRKEITGIRVRRSGFSCAQDEPRVCHSRRDAATAAGLFLTQYVTESLVNVRY